MTYRDYLIIGAGLAGASVCQAIRKYDKKGSICLVGNEPILPYDRRPLTGGFLTSANPALADIQQLSDSWYKRNKVEVRLSSTITQINVERHIAVLSTGQAIEFKKCCLATGSLPHRPGVAGAKLGNIIYLRNAADARGLRESIAREKNVVVVGGGIVAAETSASLRKLGCNVTLMCRDRFLWQKRVDVETSKWLTTYFERKGVSLMMQETINGFEGKTIVKNIQTKSGNRFPAGIVVMAVGSDPDMRLVQNTPLSSPNGTPVTATLETEEKGVFAAGDVALYPDTMFGGVRRTSSYQNSVDQGTIAGWNMTGKRRQKFEAVPRYTSSFFDLNFEFLGDFSLAPQLVELDGDRAKKTFTALYYQGDKLSGAVMCNVTPQHVAKIQKLFKPVGKK